ncbi:albumin-binding GA domain-containing protein [Streptococcus halichoeri]|uniref:albumin-binding GA domain-containing protein n=1 Tax=Streptococcus halichoeri TaxID=254785 RepID=UPI00135CC6E0|nr:albumin-binding GA domain-containing protein [Streptococcus halichoeri]
MENKKMQSYLRKSAFGIASVSAAVLAGVTSVQAADPSEIAGPGESLQLAIAMQKDAQANEALDNVKAKALDNVDAKTNLSTDEKTNFAAELQDAKSMEAVNKLNTQINKDVIATNLQGMAEGINALTGDVKTPADFKLEFAKDDAKKALKAAGVSDFYIKKIDGAKTVDSVKALKDSILDAVAKSKADQLAKNVEGIAEGINTLTGDVKTPDDFKLEFAKDDAKKALKAAGVSDYYIKKIDGAKTVEGVKSLKDFILNSLAKKDQPTPTPEVKPAPTPEVKPAPETKPAEPKAPGMPQVKPGKAAPAADAPAAKSNVKHLASNPVAMKSAANQLPSTGDSANPFFTAAAFAVMTSAGMVTLAAKRKEN